MAITIKDIARETGYAISTVSRVLNNRPDVSEETRQKIRSVVEEKGFVPNSYAKRLKLQTGSSICILVKGYENVLFTSIVEKMQKQIEKVGFSSIFRYIDEDSDEIAEALRMESESKPQGFAFLGGNLKNFQKGFSRLASPGILVANSASALGFGKLSSVSVDDTKGASLAIEYLISMGHKQIGILGGDIDSSYTSRLRYHGCLQSLAIAGIILDKESQYQSCLFSFQSAYHNAMQLNKKFSDMTALFCMSDVMAIGAMRAFRDLGLSVPEDISVMGYDGIELSEYYCPRLTTIRQSDTLLAERGVEIILDKIRKGSPATHEIVPCALIERESVKSLK